MIALLVAKDLPHYLRLVSEGDICMLAYIPTGYWSTPPS